jgi:hypothetical protein
MFLASWYLHKAEQCARMAKLATDSHRRDSYEEDQRLWLVILAEYEASEERHGALWRAS